MSSKGTTKPPSGFVEYTPAQQVIFDSLKDKIESTYKSMGFIKTETPAAETLNNLLAKGACDQEVFTLGRYGSDKPAEMGLRFDLTVPFARFVAAYQTEISFPFKRYQIDPVFRGERAQAGRYRQFYQCDVDIVAPETLSLNYDAYILSVLDKALHSIGIDDFTIKVNHKELLESVAVSLEVQQDKVSDFFRLIDKKDKISSQDFVSTLGTLMPGPKVDELLTLLATTKELDFEKTLEHLKVFFDGRGDNAIDILSSLQATYEQLLSLGVNPQNLIFDLSIARGLNYYTGIIFETSWNSHLEIGSIASGGRYNDLVAYFSKRPYRGIGFSIGLSRIFSAFQKELMDKESLRPHDGALILVQKDQHQWLCHFYKLYATVLKGTTKRLDIYLQEKKYQDQIKYAQARKFQYAISVDKEQSLSDFENVTFKVKDLSNGQQSDCNLAKLLELLK